MHRGREHGRESFPLAGMSCVECVCTTAVHSCVDTRVQPVYTVYTHVPSPVAHAVSSVLFECNRFSTRWPLRGFYSCVYTHVSLRSSRTSCPKYSVHVLQTARCVHTGVPVGSCVYSYTHPNRDFQFYIIFLRQGVCNLGG